VLYVPPLGPPTHTSSNTSTSVIADTGSTAHFFQDYPISNRRITTTPLAIRNPNGSIMYSSHEGEIDIPNLPPAARTVHIVPDLKSHSLLSIGQLCDAGCVVEFTATTVIIQHNDIVVLQGHRTPETQLWHIEIPKAPIAQTNAAVGSATAAELVSFAHASLFSPAISTLATALSKGYIPNFPGLSSRTLRNHPPRSSAMIKGHLDQSRKNQRSTKTSLITPDPDPQSEPDPDDFPTSPPSGERSHFCYVSIMEPTGQIYTDQTGKFVTPSSNGNNYLLVLYDYDSNAILAEPMKSRHATAILSAYKLLHAKLCAAGLRPQLQRLDNECSDSLKAYMSAQDIDFQLVPPGVHRRNAAERAIRTFKNHFIAGLCSVDKDFPLHLWDRLCPKPCSASIYFVAHASIPSFLRGPRCSATSISIGHLSPHPASVSSFMRNPANV
jgi:hypothetical protein